MAEQLLAHAVDVLAAANWQRAANDKLPRPEPIPRPGMQPSTERSSLTPEQMRARLEELKRRRG